MGQALACCRSPGAATSGEALHRQRDQPAAKGLTAPAPPPPLPAAGSSSPRSAGTGPATRRTSLSGYYSATGASSDGEDEWHDALSEIDSGEGGPLAGVLPSRAGIVPWVLPAAHPSSCPVVPPPAGPPAASAVPLPARVLPAAEALAEALEEWEQEVHFHEASVDRAIQVRGRATGERVQPGSGCSLGGGERAWCLWWGPAIPG